MKPLLAPFCAVIPMLAILLPAQPVYAQVAAQTDAQRIEKKLTRTEFKTAIEKGPQQFIASLHLEPHLVKGRFVGWRIGGFAPHSGLVNSSAILVGDIIISVNDEPLERPEQFMHTWEVVAQASHVSVKLLRGSRIMVYRWTVQP